MPLKKYRGKKGGKKNSTQQLQTGDLTASQQQLISSTFKQQVQQQKNAAGVSSSSKQSTPAAQMWNFGGPERKETPMHKPKAFLLDSDKRSKFAQTHFVRQFYHLGEEWAKPRE